jgi:xanthine phosphoribosyltransferase
MEVKEPEICRILKEFIKKRGKVLDNGILKVDSFINHQVFPDMHIEIGKQFAKLFEGVHVSKVLTLESSGIVPAFVTACVLQVPMIFARKKRPITMQDVWQENAPSHTKGGNVDVFVSKEMISFDDKVLIIDDFLATGLSISALAKIVLVSGAELVGVGAVIEKTFESGRIFLENLYNVPIRSLVKISSLEDLAIRFLE